MSIPEYRDLSFYPSPQQQEERYRALVAKFTDAYGAKPDFVTRSPGRVNLIGEHIDYCYFSVLPLAIDVDFIMAVRPTAEPLVRLQNLDARFAPRDIAVPTDGSLLEIDSSVSDWSNYFKCAYLVAQIYIQKNYPALAGKPLKGMEVVAHGNIPTGGGLSSSAGFVCATSLAVLRCNGIEVDKQQLTAITVDAEHYLGVNNGGMDQAASVCGMVNHALYVQFKPKLVATPFPFPETNPPLTFLVANTLVTSNKYETAPTNYNLRVVEVSVAASLLAKKFGLTLAPDGNLATGTLRGFMEMYCAEKLGYAAGGDIDEQKKKLNAVLQVLETAFSKSEYTTEEAAEALGVSVEEFTKVYLTKFRVRFTYLKVYNRAKHVYSEALRVLEALTILRSKAGGDFFEKFGGLMDESQKSCSELYECSCPEIKAVCEIARANGSFGSRLTGAGWGGSTVHLVPSDKVEAVKRALIDQYYKKQFPDITEQQLQDAIIASKPACGSCVYLCS